jgi:hypothetical protein
LTVENVATYRVPGPKGGLGIGGSDMGNVPWTPAEATPEFVTTALRSGGVIDDGSSVAEVEYDVIGEGVGIVGQLARMTLRYGGDAIGAPSSMILKIPSQYPENRMIGDHFDFYQREGRFYEQIGDRSAVRTPHCYYNHIDPEANEFALLLEDFGDRTIISQVSGIGPERAEEAVRAIALIHAEWWMSPMLDSLTWMPRIVDPVSLAAGAHYQQAAPVFADRAGDVLSDEALRLVEPIGASWVTMATDGFGRVPTTVVHGDFRADNLMFDDHQSGREHVGVIDWQISYRGAGVTDVAYLLTQSMTVETRRAHERDIVAAWYDALASALGAAPDGFDAEDAWTEYRRATPGLTVYPVVALASMDPANDRGLQLVTAMAERAFTAVLDLEAAAFLPT